MSHTKLASQPTRGHGMSEELFEEYLKDETKIPSLKGKVVAITGTTTGLGFNLARAAILKEARKVLLLNRTSGRSKLSEQDLKTFTVEGSETELQTIHCDLMDLSSIRETAKQINESVGKMGGMDVLCCNAGIMMMPDNRTKDGFEVQMQTNQLSHALLINLVWSSLQQAEKARGEARVVLQSSSARDGPNKMLDRRFYEKSEPLTLGGNGAWFITQVMGCSEGPISRYHQSKLANSAFAMALHHKLADKQSNIKSVACEPGYAVTPLQTTSSHLPSWLNWVPVSKQSAADGCLNAAMACFSLDASSGDMFVPESGLVGPPKKVIEAGSAVKKGTETLTCDPENQFVVWEGCEKALDITFGI